MATATSQAYQQFIGGDWVGAADGATFEDRDPFTGETVATVAAGGAEDARRAIASAGTAFEAWAATPPAVRQEVFLKAAEVLESRQDEVVSLLARETGCGFGFGMFQMHFVPGLLRQAAALAYAPIGTVIPSDTGAFSMGLRRPVGVVGAIAPWNAALILSARSIAAPLALGNTVVLKPSEWSPFVGGLIWGEILSEAGLPAGVLNVVTHAPGGAQPIGDELVSNPAVRRLNFTGSTTTGRKLAEAAGRHLKRIVLELGGYNPLVILADADVEYAVNAATFGSFLHQGQICMSARRIVVERPIAGEFVDRLVAKTKTLKVGDPKEMDTIIGPLINESALALVKERVEDAVAKGAKVLAGGEAVGPCYAATVLADVPENAEFAQAETFGPVVALEVVDSADQAIERANATSYGLSSGIITSDPDRGLALAQRLDAGIVHVNDQPVGDEPQMPFGGVKDSGFGRFGGQAVVDEFTELRWITVQSGSHPFPF
ncbi:MAG: aldehyde dehydrogenase family protein [Gaiellaceae bacterium]